MGNKYYTILCKEDLSRITIDEDRIKVDVHGLKTMQAQVLLTNLIALERHSFILDVIHGYRHGTAIKQMIMNTILSKRVVRIEHPTNNHGESLLYITAM